MKRIRPRLVWTLGVAAVSACAYFNGLYNANRLARDARKAEEQGRSGEARSLWAQAAVKAESVAVRYPESKYRDDALLLMGRALRETGSCNRAIEPLRVAADSSPSPTLRTRARVVLGECLVELRRLDSAVAVLTLVESEVDSGLAAIALLWRGRALLQQGRYEAAVNDLLRIGGHDAAFDLAVAYAGLDSLDLAMETLEARVDGPYQDAPWLAALDSLGARDRHRATALVDRLVALPGLTAGQRARLLLADGERRASLGDQARAAERFAAAERVAPDSVEGGAARGQLAVAELRQIGDIQSLRRLLNTIREAARLGGPAARIASPFIPILQTVTVVLEDRQVASRDLWLFALAEAVRDSLGAAPLAAALFQQLQVDHPTSFVAPKALLAAAALDPTVGDSILVVLRRAYPDSPYTRALHGEAGPAFAAAEDSLRALLASQVGEGLQRGPTEADDEVRRRRLP